MSRSCAALLHFLTKVCFASVHSYTALTSPASDFPEPLTTVSGRPEPIYEELHSKEGRHELQRYLSPLKGSKEEEEILWLVFLTVLKGNENILTKSYK